MKIDTTKSYAKILVIQTAFLGDVVLATALLEKLNAFFPAAKIDILLRKGAESLLYQHPFLNEVLLWEKDKKWRSWWQCRKAVRAKKYDLLINLQRFGSMAALAATSGAGEIRGFDTSWLSRFFSRRYVHDLDAKGQRLSLHETARNQSLIADITDALPALPRLYPSQEQGRAAFDKLQKLASNTSSSSGINFDFSTPFVCFAPASVWATKQLPLPKWWELAKRLPAETAIVLLGAKSDLALCGGLLADIKAGNPTRLLLNAAGELNLLQTAAVMAAAVMNYVNDSAPLHIASAMNAPVTAFFCSTVPAFGFTPLSDDSRILQTREKLACRPCGVHGHKKCPLGHFRCGDIELG
jgi:heptosyltransferase-2